MKRIIYALDALRDRRAGNIRIGFDPGNTGAIAILNTNSEYIAVIDMPVMALNGKKQQVNGTELAKTLRRYQSLSSEAIIAFVEDVHTMAGQGITSSGNFMMGKGVILGVLCALGIPHILVTPQSWKKRAGLVGTDKDMARTLAQRLYPMAELGLKKHIGRADALLIAKFGSKE